jgi:hypothetical protein
MSWDEEGHLWSALALCCSLSASALAILRNYDGHMIAKVTPDRMQIQSIQTKTGGR